MPRRFDFFDYAVPDDMVVSRGNLVEIPFRSSILRGVVLAVSDSVPSKKIKPIISLLESNVISSDRLTIFERLASDLIQSTASLLHIALQKKPKRKVILPAISSARIKHAEVPYLRSVIALIKTQPKTFIEILDLVQGAALAEGIRKSIQGITWVVVPHHHDALTVPQAMTRMDVLASAEKPDTIVILRSGCPEHASYDRNPRYDVRDFAELASEIYGTRVVYADVTPRVREVPLWYRLQEPVPRAPVDVVDLRAESKRGDMVKLLSEKTLEAANKALQSGKSVLLSYNRREQEVDRTLREYFPGNPILHIEKGFEATLPTEPAILLTTRYFTESIYQPLDPPNLGLIVDLQADIGLHGGEYDAIEQAIIRLYELRGIAARLQTPFIVQTYDGALIQRIMQDPRALLASELEARKALNYPPFGVLLTVGSEEKRISRTEFEQQKSSLKMLDDDIIIKVCH